MLSRSGSTKKLTKRDKSKKKAVSPASTGTTIVPGTPGTPPQSTVTFASPVPGGGTPLVTVIPQPQPPAPVVPPPAPQWGRVAPTQGPSASRAALDLTSLRFDYDLRPEIEAELGPQAAKLDMVLDALSAAGRLTSTRAELVSLTKRAGAAYDELVRGGRIGRDDAIALDMYQTKLAQDGLNRQLNVTGVDGITTGQARFTHAFLGGNQGLLAYLAQKKIAYAFNRTKLGSFGEGLFENNTVYLGRLYEESPQAFLNMVLHETGHATYQRLLIPEGALPGSGYVPTFWASGEAHTLEVERTGLEEAARTAQAAGQPVPPGNAARLAEINKIFARELPHEPWGALPPETRELYDAWTVLRQSDGQHLLGVDFTSSAPAASRRSYQAGAFGEFIAESFMMTATGALDAHIRKMRTEPGIPDEVRRAWQVADRILGQHARQTVLGRPPTV